MDNLDSTRSPKFINRGDLRYHLHFGMMNVGRPIHGICYPPQGYPTQQGYPPQGYPLQQGYLVPFSSLVHAPNKHQLKKQAQSHVNNALTTVIVVEPVASSVDSVQNGNHEEEAEGYSVYIKGLSISVTKATPSWLSWGWLDTLFQYLNNLDMLNVLSRERLGCFEELIVKPRKVLKTMKLEEARTRIEFSNAAMFTIYHMVKEPNF
uniref:Ras GTPase-activating protein-binding protein 1-like isoform X1 n=1 Tax=Tanacetum cinerariifolium TaxID=118510 RepID=A0A6L2LD27_TANCI|nr:Ras GTPase-activating protein-binding protein 1-like isoform X1 [Tanacetum cinerariifolium]